jgi:DNA-binding beta-propeller fold protein YncE
MGLATDNSGNVYVADTCNNRIQEFTADGKFLNVFGSKGSGEGQFLWPYDLEIDAEGNIYVADAGNSRIQKFTNTGTFICAWGIHGSGKDNRCIHTA